MHKIIEESDKYVMVRVPCEYGLRISDIERIESEIKGDFVASEFVRGLNQIQILLRKINNEVTE